MNEAIDYGYYREEKINGKIYYMAPSSNPHHEEIITNITYLLKKYMIETGKNCIVYGDGVDVYLSGNIDDDYVIPDVSVVCDLSKISDRGIIGAPLFIAEVISLSSIECDEKDKLELYEKYGVKEYWIVDYKNKLVKQYILSDGKYISCNFHYLMSRFEFNKLSDAEKEKKKGKSKFFISVFPDLEVDLSNVFRI